MKTFTHSEVLAYIHAQDPAREVNMRDNLGISCGCLMVQMAKDLLHVTQPLAGYILIHDEDHIPIAVLANGIGNYSNQFTETTYAELQAHNPL